jgi:hypothetical protein
MYYLLKNAPLQVRNYHESWNVFSVSKALPRRQNFKRCKFEKKIQLHCTDKKTAISAIDTPDNNNLQLAGIKTAAAWILRKLRP